MLLVSLREGRQVHVPYETLPSIRNIYSRQRSQDTRIVESSTLTSNPSADQRTPSSNCGRLVIDYMYVLYRRPNSRTVLISMLTTTLFSGWWERRKDVHRLALAATKVRTVTTSFCKDVQIYWCQELYKSNKLQMFQAVLSRDVQDRSAS